jgi:tetratricopeptide (TPR) repeat protein
LDKDPENADGIFCALSAQSYQALMFSFSKDYLQAINSARKVYGFIKQGFDKKKEFPDFNYSSGLFYFYADQFPKTHPMVKPLMLFFEDGNKQLGINNLNVSMLKGIYTRQESLILLSYIYIKYENNPLKSLEYSEKLYFNYPNNPFALSKYIEGLLFSGNYLKAKEMLPKLLATNSEYFKMIAELYTAYLIEKHDKRNDIAKAHYIKTLVMAGKLFQKTDDPQSFCYLGLGRIAEEEKDRKKALLYYKKAEDIAEYEMVKIECKKRMQSNGRSLPQH